MMESLEQSRIVQFLAPIEIELFDRLISGGQLAHDVTCSPYH